MAQNDSQPNPSAFFNTYKVSLTREQQKALALLVPRDYSFQPFKATQSLDEESLKSEPKQSKKKQNQSIIKEQKDPDYSASYVPTAKELPSLKVESSQVIPGGEPFLECYLILKKLKKSIYSWPFKVPVDPKALGIPEYLNVILQPIDLKTIEQNLRKQGYKHPAEFHRDIYKIMMNSYKFNQKNSEVFATTVEFQEEYLKIVKDAKEGKLISNEKKLMKLQEKMSVNENSMNFKQMSFEAQQPPLVMKQTRHYNKKDKSEKQNQQKDAQRPIAVKEKQKDKGQMMRMKMEEEEEEREIELPIKSKQYIDPFFSFGPPQQPQQHVKTEQMIPEIIEPKLSKQVKVQVKEQAEQPQFSISNEHLRKTKSKVAKQTRPKEKKVKRAETMESPAEIKELLKENTQAENEKNIIFNQVQKKLTDLLKRLNDYQMPNKAKGRQNQKNAEGSEHPNFNNFTTITASEKKKLAQKISSLPPSDLKYVIEICFRNKRCKSRDDEGAYEIDLEKVDGKVLKELSNFVGMRIKKTKKDVSKSKEGFKFEEQEAADELFNDQLQAEQEAEEDEQQEYSVREEGDEFHRGSGSYENILDHEIGYNDFHEPYNNGHHDALEMIDSQVGHHRHNPDDQYSNEFRF